MLMLIPCTHMVDDALSELHNRRCFLLAHVFCPHMSKGICHWSGCISYKLMYNSKNVHVVTVMIDIVFHQMEHFFIHSVKFYSMV